MPAAARSALLALCLLTAPALAQAETPVPELTLTAEGEVLAAPDTAIVTLGVIKQAGTAGEALSANNAAMRATLDALKAAGIAERDLGTTAFSIEPVMVYPKAAADGSRRPPYVAGYRVSNEVTVKIRDIANAGALLDRVVRVGANNIRSLAFSVENREQLMDEARSRAMAALKARAELYAEAGGFRLKRLLTISEQSAPNYARPMMKAMAAPPAADAEAVPFATGEQRIAITVNASWEIGQDNQNKE